ncbi:MAG: OmpH family outer membrane protein [Phycisphaerae bacterium]|nr:OmpH family outer membrane protein [Phycisphaerae bacterium]
MHTTSQRPRRTFRILALIAAALVVGMVAARTLVPTRPAVVAVVNLERVFNMSYIWANKLAEIEAVKQALDAELSARQDEVKRLDEELKSFKEGSAAAVKLQPKVNEAISDFTAFRQFASLKMEAARSKALRETYEEIQAVTSKFASSNGIDMVIVDDSIPKMSRGNAASTVQQISARRVLYATKQFDISADLLAALNAAFPLNPGVKEPADENNALDPSVGDNSTAAANP